MKLDLQIQNLDKVRDALSKLSGPQAKIAYSKAINDTGFMVRKAMQAELSAKFDRVTNFIKSAPKLIPATPDKLSATIIPTRDGRNPLAGGGAGVDPQHVLQAQEFGGRRADKRFEVALRQRGILPTGKQIAIPGEKYGGPYPGSEDGRGNFRGDFVKKLLAYLGTSSGAMNGMSKRQREATLKRYQFKSNLRTKREIKLMDGMEFFVSDGAGKGSLGAGIWARNGKVLKCVVAFVSTATYQPLISMDGIARKAGAQDYLDRRVRFRVRELAESV